MRSSICLSRSLPLLLSLAVPVEMLAGQHMSGPKSEAAAVIEKLEELRKTIEGNLGNPFLAQSWLLKSLAVREE